MVKVLAADSGLTVNQFEQVRSIHGAEVTQRQTWRQACFQIMFENVRVAIEGAGLEIGFGPREIVRSDIFANWEGPAYIGPTVIERSENFFEQRPYVLLAPETGAHIGELPALLFPHELI